MRAYWSETEIAFLKDNLDKLKIREIAAGIGRTAGAVRNYLRHKQIRRCKAKARPWTRAEHMELMTLLETNGTREVAAELGRSFVAIRTMMTKHHLKPYSGLLSLAAACEKSGYHSFQLLRARDALQQRWKRVDYSRGKMMLMTEDQLDGLCEWLKVEPPVPPNTERFWIHVIKTDTCWYWTGTNKFLLYLEPHRRGKDGRLLSTLINPHRYAWMLVKGDPGERKIYSDCEQHGPGYCINPHHGYMGRVQGEPRTRQYARRRATHARLRKLAEDGHITLPKWMTDKRVRVYRKRKVDNRDEQPHDQQ